MSLNPPKNNHPNQLPQPTVPPLPMPNFAKLNPRAAAGLIPFPSINRQFFLPNIDDEYEEDYKTFSQWKDRKRNWSSAFDNLPPVKEFESGPQQKNLIFNDRRHPSDPRIYSSQEESELSDYRQDVIDLNTTDDEEDAPIEPESSRKRRRLGNGPDAPETVYNQYFTPQNQLLSPKRPGKGRATSKAKVNASDPLGRSAIDSRLEMEEKSYGFDYESEGSAPNLTDVVRGFKQAKFELPLRQNLVQIGSIVAKPNGIEKLLPRWSDSAAITTAKHLPEFDRRLQLEYRLCFCMIGISPRVNSGVTKAYLAHVIKAMDPKGTLLNEAERHKRINHSFCYTAETFRVKLFSVLDEEVAVEWDKVRNGTEAECAAWLQNFKISEQAALNLFCRTMKSRSLPLVPPFQSQVAWLGLSPFQVAHIRNYAQALFDQFKMDWWKLHQQSGDQEKSPEQARFIRNLKDKLMAVKCDLTYLASLHQEEPSPTTSAAPAAATSIATDPAEASNDKSDNRDAKAEKEDG